MDRKQFWDIIEETRRPDDDERHAALVDRLRQLTPDEIVAFDRAFWKALADAYREDLWGAAYTINGGCSDDGFHYFRCWLVGVGRCVYEAALKDPDMLAGVVEPDRGYESSLDAAAAQAYEAVTGRDDFYDHPRDSSEPDNADLGEAWDFDDDQEVRRRFPRLAQMYLRPEDDE